MALFVALFSVVSSAQEINCKISKGEVYKQKHKNSYTLKVEEDGNGGLLIINIFYVSALSSTYSYYLEHYDSNLKLINEYEYKINESRFNLKNQTTLLGIIMNGNDLSFIEFKYDSSKTAYVCNALTSSIKDFDFKPKELFQISSELVDMSPVFFGSDTRFDSDSGASMIVNEDKSAFSVAVDIKNKDYETHKLYLFDSALNKKIEHDFKRNIKDKKFIYENLNVSKDGNTMYLLGKAYTKEKEKKKEGGKYQFELTKISKDSEKTVVFDTEEHYSSSLKTTIFPNRLTCVGFYSNINDDRYRGVSYFEVDPETMEIKKAKFNPFTEQFLFEKFGNKKEKVKEKEKYKELKNLSFRQLFVTSNNEIIINAEEYFTTEHHFNSSMNGGSQIITTSHYNDIVSAKISTSGDMLWAKNINKNQSNRSLLPSVSYKSIVKDENTYFFIYNDEKVETLDDGRLVFGRNQRSKKKAKFMAIRVDSKGNLDFKELFEDNDNEIPININNSIVSGNSIYFICKKEKKKQITKIIL